MYSIAANDGRPPLLIRVETKIGATVPLRRLVLQQLRRVNPHVETVVRGYGHGGRHSARGWLMRRQAAPELQG
jgi:hypothetical protein